MLRRVMSVFGLAVRETGQALDRLGCRMQGKENFAFQYSRHRQIMNLYDQHPQIDVNAFIAPNASVIGDVHIGNKASVWYNAVLRGDQKTIVIGEQVSVHDLAVVQGVDNPHADSPTVEIGANTTVGRGAQLRGCVVGADCVIGSHAIVGEGCVLGEGSVVGASAVVAPGTNIGPNERWEGSPAQKVGTVSTEERAKAVQDAATTFQQSQAHKKHVEQHMTL